MADADQGTPAGANDNFLRQFRESGTRKWKQFTATQFMEVWNHYDVDESGYIEGSELDSFLREFVSSVNTSEVGPEVVSDAAFSLMKATFMDAFDDNKDEKIDIAELAQILPTDESFLLLFRRNTPLESSVEFMKVWRQFDKDSSGHIEANELKEFLEKLLKDAKQVVSAEKLDEYTTTVLKLFDRNKDGKLQLSEMARLLPVKENYLTNPILKSAGRITKREIERLFDIYDKDKNAFMEGDELGGFLKDLMELAQKDYDSNDLAVLENAILNHWDVNRDGKLCKSELSMLLLQQCRLAAQNAGVEYHEGGDNE